MRIKLNNVRLSYVNVFTAKAIQGGQDPKYSCQIIMSEDHPQVEALEKAVLSVAKEKFPKLVTGAKFPTRLKNPIRSGEEREGEDAYADSIFFNANNKKRPTVIDRDKTPLTEEDNVIYSGCYANVIIDLFAYDTAGNKGVAASIGGVQFKKDGEALGGKGVGADYFEEEEFEDEDYEV